MSQTFSTWLPQKPPCMQKTESSVIVRPAPVKRRARVALGAVGAASVPSNPIFACVLSQKGFCDEWPQRHSRYVPPPSSAASLRHVSGSWCSEYTTDLRLSGTPPLTTYG